jgi:hypothetical protein
MLCTLCNAQENKKDGAFVVYTMNTDEVDLKHDIYRDCPNASQIEPIVNNLIKTGRYIKSIVNTKFGVIVLHESNTNNVEQIYVNVELNKLKAECNRYFKSGYVVDYYNKNGGYALFKKDPKVTKQSVLGSLKQSQLEKLNKDGMFIVVDNYSSVVVQNGRDDIEEQVIGKHPSMYRLLCNSYYAKCADGWTVGAVADDYDSEGDSYQYSVVYNKVKPLYRKNQDMLDILTENKLTEYLNKKGKAQCCLVNIWGGLSD